MLINDPGGLSQGPSGTEIAIPTKGIKRFRALTILAIPNHGLSIAPLWTTEEVRRPEFDGLPRGPGGDEILSHHLLNALAHYVCRVGGKSIDTDDSFDRYPDAPGLNVVAGRWA